MTAFRDRNAMAFKKAMPDLAWGSFAWCLKRAGESDRARWHGSGWNSVVERLLRVNEVQHLGLAARRSPDRQVRVNVTPAVDPELAIRLALAEAELRAMKDMLAEVRQSRDDWKVQAEQPPYWRAKSVRPARRAIDAVFWEFFSVHLSLRKN